jgi:hypothetical protein
VICWEASIEPREKPKKFAIKCSQLWEIEPLKIIDLLRLIICHDAWAYMSKQFLKIFILARVALQKIIKSVVNSVKIQTSHQWNLDSWSKYQWQLITKITTMESKNKQDKESRGKITTPRNVYPVRSNNDLLWGRY